jgi:hypothetical protein
MHSIKEIIPTIKSVDCLDNPDVKRFLNKSDKLELTAKYTDADICLYDLNQDRYRSYLHIILSSSIKLCENCDCKHNYFYWD